MNKSLLVALMLASSVAFAGDKSKAKEAPKGDEAIKALGARIDAALTTHDAKAALELYAADATFVAPVGDGKLVKGKADILKVHEMMLGGPLKDATPIHTLESVRWIGKDAALADFSVAWTGMKMDGAPAGAPAPAFHAVILLTLKDGKWLFSDVRPYLVPAPPAAPTKGI